MMIDIAGQKFSRLKAVKFTNKIGNEYCWLFVCSCGRKKSIRKRDVMTGKTRSCGCYKKEYMTKVFGKHFKTRTKIYSIWNQMKQRCFNKNDKGFKNYGGRGITVCKRWLKFENFYKDMGERPTELSLDRINNDKGYSPHNCKWSTRTEQNNNKRKNSKLKL